MKTKSVLPLMAALSALSFGAFAADSISLQQAQDLKPMGTVSVSGIDAAPSDIHQALNQAADAKGARAYHVTEAYDENGNWHATAQLYK
ncbi:YdgH/BhsA/McbA-like domain containing protein [Candidatus Sodalis sp. SoCistrobi]|uniref:YdgH/BhsA/McbA-like domain containing protein n=1 Tax=Candidatus Sodalis sp. SoCistrobi TaxID=1922216 RepID=UPI000938FCD7|nr:YdgH/BhsA/McbA-like domain containing protein [Candidatus Sodalis sp. SoCistrobi]